MTPLKFSLNVAAATTLLLSSSSNAGILIKDFIKPSRSETCVDQPSDIARTRVIRDAMSAYGGLTGIAGYWRLSGLAGVIVKVRVTIGYTANYFFVQIDKDEPKRLRFCFSPETPEILRLRVPKANDPKLALILLKPGDIGESIYVAAEKSNWTFKKFKRVTE